MKYILIFLALISNVNADDLRVKIVPEKPVVNEAFNIEFIIRTEQGTDPVINFDPLGLEIISRSNVSTSTRLTYVNGKSTMERTITLSYEAIASKAGGAYLRNIRIELNGQKVNHKTVYINILKTAKKTNKVFVKADVEKTRIYVGESVIVRYYLYNRSDTPLSATDIKKFPKLGKFMKRFHQEPSNPQRVRVDGNIYTRRIMYTAQLFPEKAGIFKVDPITLGVAYSNRKNTFGNFGLNFQRGRSTRATISSKPVDIECLELPPVEGAQNFSGLVGNHTFSLKINKQNFIANEPIEIELLIEGDGALELFEAPLILNDASIEEFEKNNDLITNKDFTASKRITYTYLGRDKTNLQDIVIPITYFNPETKKYIIKNLNLGNIKIAPIGQATVSSNSPKFLKTELENKIVAPPSGEVMANPILFKPIVKIANTFLYGAKEILAFLVGVFFLSVLYIGTKKYKNYRPSPLNNFESIYSNGLTYIGLHRVLRLDDSTATMSEVIKGLDLNEDTKTYFLNLISQLNDSYAKDGVGENIPPSKKYLKELEQVLQSRKDEDDG